MVESSLGQPSLQALRSAAWLGLQVSGRGVGGGIWDSRLHAWEVFRLAMAVAGRPVPPNPSNLNLWASEPQVLLDNVEIQPLAKLSLVLPPNREQGVEKLALTSS